MVLVLGDWKTHAWRGLAALAFGLATLVWPAVTLYVLVVLFGALALVDGVATLVALARRRVAEHGNRFWLLVRGLLGVAAGIVAFVWPGITALALVYVIAAWALLVGATEIAAAVQHREEAGSPWLLGLTGALTVLFGVLAAIFPGAGALAITWMIGWFAVLRGGIDLALAWQLRKVENERATSDGTAAVGRPGRSRPAPA
jgi:uncharacterized membrane protein HdeD (DUF308 family)